MIRMFALLCALSCAVPAAAADAFVLLSDRETAQVSVEETRMTAWFAERNGALDVTLLVSGADASVLRARVALEDGQSHQLFLAGDEALQGVRFSVTRRGRTIELQGVATAGPELAARN